MSIIPKLIPIPNPVKILDSDKVILKVGDIVRPRNRFFTQTDTEWNGKYSKVIKILPNGDVEISDKFTYFLKRRENGYQLYNDDELWGNFALIKIDDVELYLNEL